MRRRLWPFAILFLAGVLLGDWHCAPLVWAQEESEPDVQGPAEAPAADTLPGETFPKVIYLKDKDGNLQAVLGMPYEQVMALWKRDQQLVAQDEQPAFSIQSLELQGTAAGDRAELVARVKLSVHAAGWVGVPLRLNGAELREEPTYTGPGEHVLHVDSQNQGHVVWIRGPADEAHEVTLKLVAKVERIGPESRLALSLPRAGVSQFQLHVPLANAVAEVSEGSTLDSVRALAGGKTELKVIGLSGDFELSWHPADSQVASLPTILEVSTAQLIRMNGRSINTEAKLTVRSLGSEFDTFQVRLPRGADYIGPSEPGVSLVAVDVSAPGGKLYDVKLDKKTVGPIDVRLVTERVHNAERDAEPLELAGFEVLAAVRQWGTVGVQVEGNWQVVWGDSNHVRSVDDAVAERALSTLLTPATPSVRVENRPAEGERGELVASFEYFVQPYSLTARVVPQRTRMRVEPEYVLEVGREEARLKARLKYTILGAKVRSLDVELPGWELVSVGPPTLVDVDAALTGAEASPTIPLLQATGGEVELLLEARRKLDGSAGEIDLSLPRTPGEELADVAILSDDNIELIPRLDETRDLAPQPLRPAMQLPARQQEPIVYRTTGQEPRFVADRKVHEQSISTAIATNLEVSADHTAVEEVIRYQVAYQPTDHFTLIVPRGVRRENLTILYDGQAIDAAALQTLQQEDGPLRVNLPSPVIGRCELQVRYSLAHEKPPQQASTLVSVPLVVPGEGALSDNQLVVSAPQGISVHYPQGPWTTSGRATTADEGIELALSAERAIGEVTLAVSSKQSQTRSSVAITRALVQTHLSGRVRQDRVLLRLTANQPTIDVTLPGGADMRSLSLALDGLPINAESIRQRMAVLRLPGGPREYLLELRYHFTTRPPQGPLLLEAPQLKAAPWVDQVYWELRVPAGEHVVFAPAGYVEEQRWTWADYFWRRQPSLTEPELEAWVGVPSGGAAMPASGPPSALAGYGAVNRYLFSTVGQIETLDLYTLGRARLVLLASLPLLACGLVLIYWPAARHPATLLMAGIVLGSASLIVPQATLLLAQASVLGLVLAVVAALLARLTPPRVVPASLPTPGSSYVAVERSITEMYHRPPSGGSRPPSATADPLVPTSPEVDS